MNHPIVQSQTGVTLIAGGPVLARDMQAARALAPMVVAVDGGADRAMAFGVRPAAVIGDLDSISAGARVGLADVLHFVDEQVSTDFDKALRHITAPFVLALGCLGGRVDHELAALSVLVQHTDKPCFLIGREDVIFAAPPVLDIAMLAGDRFSLFPMAEVTGHSDGLEWPIAGLRLAPNGRVGTSNRATGPVRLQTNGAGLLVIVPRARLRVALSAFVSGQ